MDTHYAKINDILVSHCTCWKFYFILGVPFSLWLMNMYHNIIWLFLFITHQLILYYLILTKYYYSSTHSILFDSHYLLLINSFCIIWSSLLFTTLHLSLFLFICSYLYHIFHFGWLMQMPYIIPVLLFITHQPFLYYLIITIITLIISVCLILFFPHIFHFWWLMPMPYIISVLLFVTHEVIRVGINLIKLI